MTLSGGYTLVVFQPPVVSSICGLAQDTISCTFYAVDAVRPMALPTFDSTPWRVRGERMGWIGQSWR